MSARKIIALAIAGYWLAHCSMAGAQDEMYWESNFGPITLASIAQRSETPEGSSTARLILTGDVSLSADNGTGARLTEPGGDYLVTEYALEFDGDGQSATGREDVSYTSYGSFISTHVTITKVGADSDVVVTLNVRASMNVGDVADASSYAATQTLTASWAG
jgi:hypothetical protein